MHHWWLDSKDEKFLEWEGAIPHSWFLLSLLLERKSGFTWHPLAFLSFVPFFFFSLLLLHYFHMKSNKKTPNNDILLLMTTLSSKQGIMQLPQQKYNNQDWWEQQFSLLHGFCHMVPTRHEGHNCCPTMWGILHSLSMFEFSFHSSFEMKFNSFDLWKHWLFHPILM